MQEVITFTSSGLPETARVLGFGGSEALSRPYQLEILVVVAGAEAGELDLDDAIGSKGTLRFDRDDGRPPFQFHGVLGAVELVHDTGDLAVVRAVLVPRLWRLSLTQKSRMFTSQTIPDILRAVFDDAGLPGDSYSLQLTGSYGVEEHVCQYRESDLDFVSRWMEREGIYYFFDHESDEEKLIVTDVRSAHRELGPAVPFRALGSDDVSRRAALHTFRCQRRSLPGTVRLRDYDYTKPTLDVSGKADVSRDGLGEVSVYGGRFFSPADGARLAKLRAEELKAGEKVFAATGDAVYLRSGFLFRLEDHPRAAFDAKYLATVVEHHANQAAWAPELAKLTGLDEDDAVYRVEVKAIAETVQYRAPRATSWPRIHGFENAIVDGERESEYAQVDDQGRYRVRFLFDESDLADGKASTWVRMMQPHGGGIEGWHFPLRKGTEVVVTFLGGDPDRPVIAGVVPTIETPSPVTSANNTKNIIQTGGRNRIEIEDKKGQERITLSTPYANSRIRFGAPNSHHEMIIQTDEATLLDAGGNLDVTVGKNKSEDVTGNTTEIYHGYQSTTVHSGRAEVYSTQVTHVKGNRDEHIGGALKQTVDAGVTLTSGSVIQTIHGSAEISCDGPYHVTAPASHFKVQGPWKGLVVGATSDTFIGIKNSNLLGGEVKITIGASVEVKAAGEAKMSLGASLEVKAAMQLSLVAGLRLSETGGMGISINTGPEIKFSTVRADQVSAELKKAGLALMNSGATIFS